MDPTSLKLPRLILPLQSTAHRLNTDSNHKTPITEDRLNTDSNQETPITNDIELSISET